MPNIPTIAETVIPGFDSSLWLALGAPAGTPDPIIRRFNREIVEILKDPAMSEAFAHHGIDVESSTPEELASRISTDIKAYREVVLKAGIQIK